MTLTLSSYKKLQRDERAPDFKLKGIDGKTYSLADFKGRALLVIFMCNHCPYVQPKMEYFVRLQQKYGPKLQVVGINSNDTASYPEDSFGKMKEYAAKYGFNFPYLIDETQAVAKSYGAECTPDPFLFGTDHKLVYHGRFDDAHGKPHSAGKTAEMEEAVKQVLEGKDASVQWLPSMGCNIKWKADF